MSSRIRSGDELLAELDGLEAVRRLADHFDVGELRRGARASACGQVIHRRRPVRAWFSPPLLSWPGAGSTPGSVRATRSTSTLARWPNSVSMRERTLARPTPAPRDCGRSGSHGILHRQLEQAVASPRQHLHFASFDEMGDAVMYCVFDERLQNQGRHGEGEGVLRHIEPSPQPLAETYLFDGEEGLGERDLLGERDRRSRAQPQALAEEAGHQETHASRRLGVGADQRRDGIQAVEQEMRIELARAATSAPPRARTPAAPARAAPPGANARTPRPCSARAPRPAGRSCRRTTAAR